MDNISTYRESYDKDDVSFGYHLNKIYLNKDRYLSYDIETYISNLSEPPTVFIIDSFNIGYKYRFSKFHKSFHYKDRFKDVDRLIPIGIPLGISSMARSILTSGVKNPLIIYTYDTGKAKKIAIDSSYKANRVPGKGSKKDYVDDAIRYSVLHMASGMNIFAMGAKDTEADDLVNDLSHKIAYGSLKPYCIGAYVISEDQDLHWNVHHNVNVFTGSRFNLEKTNLMRGIESVRAKYGVHPALLPLRKVLLGKKADGWGPIVPKNLAFNFINSYEAHEGLQLYGSKFISKPDLMDEICEAFPRVDRETVQNRIDVIMSSLYINNSFLLRSKRELPTSNDPLNRVFIRSNQKQI